MFEYINNVRRNGELYANKIQKNQNMTNNFIKVRIFLTIFILKV